MLRAIHFDAQNKLHTDLQPMDIAFSLHEGQGVLWVDFEDTTPQESEAILTKTFNFHWLAVDDALAESHYPKIDDWSSYVYIVLHAVAIDAEDPQRVDTQELDIFLGKNYIVTHHEEHMPALERVWKAVQNDTRHLKNGTDHLLYRLIDEVVGSFMPVVEKFDEDIDLIEAEIFAHPRPQTLENIFAIKRSVLYLRRIIAPQREVLNKLARDEFAVIDEDARIYFRDVYDHLVRMYDITEGARDLVTSTLDTYLSMSSNRMNDVMKTLTIITTIFMPISFLAGFFGMNFFQPAYPLEEWTSLPAFIATMTIFIAAPMGMLVWMRQRGWTQQGEPKKMTKELSPSARKVQQALEARGMHLEVVELPDSTHTAVEAAQAIGCQVGQIVKSLVFKTKRTERPLLVVASGQNRVDERRLEALVGEPLGKADADFVRQRTGFVIGGVPPLGHSEPLITFIDEDLLKYNEVWAAAGTPHAVFRLAPNQLVQMTGGQVVNIKPA